MSAAAAAPKEEEETQQQNGPKDSSLNFLSKYFSDDNFLTNVLLDCRKVLPHESYQSLLSLIHLFVLECVEKSHLKSFIEYILTEQISLKMLLMRNLFAKKQNNHDNIIGRQINQFIPAKKHLIDIRCTPSYRLITKDFRTNPTSPFINNEWYCIPHNATGEFNASFFVTTRKSQYLQALYRLEDSMFEVRNILESYKTFLASLEMFIDNIKDQIIFIDNLSHSPDNDAICTSRTLPIICIKRLYNESYKKVLDSYYKHPKKTAELLIKRLNEKINNWLELSYSYTLMWRKQLVNATKNLAKFQFLNSKHIDFRYLHPKIIIQNILDSKSPGYEFILDNKSLIEDIMNLSCRHLRRQPITMEAKSTIKYVLYHYIPEILGIYEGTMSDDDYEILGNNIDFNDILGASANLQSSTSSSTNGTNAKKFIHKRRASFSNIQRKSFPKNILTLVDDNWLVLFKIISVLYEKLSFVSEFMSESGNVNLSRQAMILTGTKLGKTYKSKIEAGNKGLLLNDIFIEYLCDFMDGNFSENEYFEKVYDIFCEHTYKIANMDRLIKSCYKQLSIILDSPSSVELMKFNCKKKSSSHITDIQQYVSEWQNLNLDNKSNIFAVKRDSNFASSKKFIFSLQYRSTFVPPNTSKAIVSTNSTTANNSIEQGSFYENNFEDDDYECQTNPIMSPPVQTTNRGERNLNSKQSSTKLINKNDFFESSPAIKHLNYSKNSNLPYLTRNIRLNVDAMDANFTVLKDTLKLSTAGQKQKGGERIKKNRYLPDTSFFLFNNNYQNTKTNAIGYTDENKKKGALDEILARIL